jgi:hypothetical protein
MQRPEKKDPFSSPSLASLPVELLLISIPKLQTPWVTPPETKPHGSKP